MGKEKDVCPEYKNNVSNSNESFDGRLNHREMSMQESDTLILDQAEFEELTGKRVNAKSESQKQTGVKKLSELKKTSNSEKQAEDLENQDELEKQRKQKKQEELEKIVKLRKLVELHKQVEEENRAEGL